VCGGSFEGKELGIRWVSLGDGVRVFGCYHDGWVVEFEDSVKSLRCGEGKKRSERIL
jgi:hypothetical protein